MDIHDRNIINSEEALNQARSGINQVRSNIKRGLKMLVFSVIRLFVETLIVMLIWNNVVVDLAPEVQELAYWPAFFGLLMIRIITGQFKIQFGLNNNKREK